MSFSDLLQQWTNAACQAWDYPLAEVDQLAGIADRLPDGLRALIVKGHESGLITSQGFRFTLKGLPSGKGPYAWLSKDSRRVPIVNWEYLVQAAEYVRIHEQLGSLGYSVLVEDRLLDITVERDGRLEWYVEVKERARDLAGLAERIASLGSLGVDLDLSERGNDALQKAKYLVRYRPEYFTLTAIGMTLNFRVSYTDDARFRLIPDLVPLP